MLSVTWQVAEARRVGTLLVSRAKACLTVSLGAEVKGWYRRYGGATGACVFSVFSVAWLIADIRRRCAFLIAGTEACNAIADAAFLKTKIVARVQLSFFDVVQMKALKPRVGMGKGHSRKSK